MTPTAKVTVQVTDDLGTMTVGQATLTLAAGPIIDDITLTPTVLPETGGTIQIMVAARSPDGRPLTFAATVDAGTIGPDISTQAPNDFVWIVPAVS